MIWKTKATIRQQIFFQGYDMENLLDFKTMLHFIP